MGSLLNLIILIALVSKATALEDLRANPREGLPKSYFCAICELVDAGDFVKPLADKNPRFNIFRLKPIKVYWGSLEAAEPSLLAYPYSKDRGKLQMLVVLRNNDFGPVDWFKLYAPISNDDRPASYYLLDGERPISGNDLKRFLEQYAQVMKKKFPLDKEDSPEPEID